MEDDRPHRLDERPFTWLDYPPDTHFPHSVDFAAVRFAEVWYDGPEPTPMPPPAPHVVFRVGWAARFAYHAYRAYGPNPSVESIRLRIFTPSGQTSTYTDVYPPVLTPFNGPDYPLIYKPTCAAADFRFPETLSCWIKAHRLRSHGPQTRIAWLTNRNRFVGLAQRSRSTRSLSRFEPPTMPNTPNRLIDLPPQWPYQREFLKYRPMPE
jgi:hypothetical protein